MGFSLSIQQTACVGLLLFALGTSCSGSPTFVADASSPDLTLPLQGSSMFGSCFVCFWEWHIQIYFCLPMAAVDWALQHHCWTPRIWSSCLLVRSLVQLSFFLSVLGMAQLDLLPLVPGVSTPGSFLFPHGASCFGFLVPVLGFAHVGSLLFLRGVAYLESSLSVLEVVSLGFFLLLRGVSCLESASSVLGVATLEPLLSLQSLCRIGPFLLALEATSLGLLPPLHGSA